MRLFFISWSGKELGLVEVMTRLKTHHEIIYWAGYREEMESCRRDFPGTIFHDVFDALAGLPAEGVSHALFPPPGEAFLNQFAETEVTVLTMMHKKYETYSLEERKHLFTHFLRYWYGVIQTYKPEALIYSDIPHTVYDFVLYALAQKLGVKTIMFETILGNEDRVVCMNDFTVGSRALLDEVRRTERAPSLLFDLPQDIQAHYAQYTSEKDDVVPTFLQVDLTRYRRIGRLHLHLKSIWDGIKDKSILERIYGFVMRRVGSNLKKEYRSVQSCADFTKDYVYVALQYQPERTSSPQGGVFVDQVLMIEMLSAALPDGWLLYVKEHPILWRRRGVKFFEYRYRGYYQRIAALHNVRIVPAETSSFELIKHSKAVATLTGTVGWEAVLRSKPALVFGYPWYQYCPGVFRVREARGCAEALAQIHKGFFVSPAQMITFLAAVAKSSFRAYFSPYCKQVSSLRVEENVKNIVSIISHELSR